MKADIYTLPEWDFVGGETQRRVFTMELETGQDCDYPDATAHLSVVEFVNRKAGAKISKNVAVQVGDSGVYCDLHVELSPEETVNLSGKYIYQLTIKDEGGNTAIPKQGIMWITENIDKDFVG